jgi:hypothetical protein
MPALFWATSRVKSEAIKSLCEWRNIVANITREEGVQNVSLNPQDINGFIPSTFVAATFNQLDNLLTFMVVIMVAGDTADKTRDLSVRLQNRVQHVAVL